MTTWREEFDKIVGEKHHLICEGKKCYCHKYYKDFIFLKLKAAFDEVEKLPKERDWQEERKTDAGSFVDEDFNDGFNQCLADIKASIKKTKEKFL